MALHAHGIVQTTTLVRALAGTELVAHQRQPSAGPLAGHASGTTQAREATNGLAGRFRTQRRLGHTCALGTIGTGSSENPDALCPGALILPPHRRRWALLLATQAVGRIISTVVAARLPTGSLLLDLTPRDRASYWITARNIVQASSTTATAALRLDRTLWAPSQLSTRRLGWDFQRGLRLAFYLQATGGESRQSAGV